MPWHRDERDALLFGCRSCLLILAAGASGLAGALGVGGAPARAPSRRPWRSSVRLFGGMVLRAHRNEARVRAFQQKRNQVADHILKRVMAGERPGRPYFVYLRPFNVDGLFVDADFRAKAGSEDIDRYGLAATRHDLESALALLLDGHGDSVCLSDKPGLAGAGHVQSTDEAWKQHVTKLCETAAGLLIVPFDTSGTRWQVARILERRWIDRTLFIMLASSVLYRWLRIGRWIAQDHRKPWEEARRAHQQSGLSLPGYDERGCVFRIGDNAVEVVGWFAGREGESLVDEVRPVLAQMTTPAFTDSAGAATSFPSA